MKNILMAPARFLRRRVRLLNEDTLVVASLFIGYLVALVWEVVVGAFGVRFYLAIAAMTLTAAVIAFVPFFIRHAPGWMSTVLISTFVGFLIESSMTSKYGSGRGLFYAAVVPVSAIILSLSLHDMVTRRFSGAPEPEAS